MKSQQTCAGTATHQCQRFVGAEIANQSIHDPSCQTHDICSKNRLHWDPVSYSAVDGPKVVSIEHTDSTHLRYCGLSADNLAISHVWSHGQGGRPDFSTRNEDAGQTVDPMTGMNVCLHRRYADIARKTFNCKSYWMDTSCIHNDHDLRTEAIANIDGIFQSSKALLVCDRDLMAMNVSSIIDKNTITEESIALRESILSVLLLSD